MKIKELFSYSPKINSPEALPHHEVEVRTLQTDSRSVMPGDVFIAVEGIQSDGHQYLEDAVSRGCVALVINDRATPPASFKGFVYRSSNTQLALEILLGVMFSYPSLKLKMLGVTGTNGKTTTSAMIEFILNSTKVPCGVIGTIDHHIGNIRWDTALTTPDKITLQQRLSDFLSHGALAAVMEVSSHALDQNRINSVFFDVAVFTNLTRDHLDYHQTMENYFKAKQRLFSHCLANPVKPRTFAIVNVDDPYGRKLQCAARSEVWTYGSTQDADYFFSNALLSPTGCRFQIHSPHGTIDAEWNVNGKHNIMNGLAACMAASALGIPFLDCVKIMSTFSHVPGRLERTVSARGSFVYIDYAHSPDALTKALETLRESLGKAAHSESAPRILTVFGCGGDRDKGKRPLMLQAALKLSDTVVITSDNPRTENPRTIIDDILKGNADQFQTMSIPSEQKIAISQDIECGKLPRDRMIFLQEDRKEAIIFALLIARPNDIVLIAGKGHENYQIIGTEKRPFSDRQIVEGQSLG